MQRFVSGYWGYVMFESFLISVSRFIWGLPLIIALLGVSIYFSFKLKFVQFFHLRSAFKYMLKGSKEGTAGDVSNFASLCTALSATLGVGNIVGVALAISTGGPGALFWIWIATFLGMAVKYAEGLLAVKYRQIGSDGSMAGGPMYYLEKGLHNKFLAKAFAIFGAGVALVGIGTWTQSNSIAASAHSFGIPTFLTALLLGITVAVVTLGGIRRIAYVAEKIVPFMACFYVIAAIAVLIIKASEIPQALSLVFIGAFSPKAIFGGGAGISVMMVVQLGMSRGIFAHESGLGSAAIAAAAAKTDSPVQQGLVSMTGAFFSVLICTMTALVLIVTNRETALFSGCATEGTLLTANAFSVGLGIPALGKYVVSFGILFFAFTTIIGWNFYGEKCVQYLWGTKAILPYKVLFLFFVVVGPFWKIDLIFTVADIVVGLMAIPNLCGLVGLRKIIVDETDEFVRMLKFNARQ
jgi:AGCS family alanine or glycine:cation symporter